MAAATMSRIPYATRRVRLGRRTRAARRVTAVATESVVLDADVVI